MATREDVAIIGAGLSGLVLALSLHQQNIPCTVYELRPAPLDIGGAISVSPNALQIMDKLGLYENVVSEGYACEALHFRSQDGELFDTDLDKMVQTWLTV
ncbi:FAD/NAD(P)-binding domain-containing protein [Penicillium lividum]|nr:FAD/NAD(P)-binding domain-containing protein [Penicillium lividum]